MSHIINLNTRIYIDFGIFRLEPHVKTTYNLKIRRTNLENTENTGTKYFFPKMSKFLKSGNLLQTGIPVCYPTCKL